MITIKASQFYASLQRYVFIPLDCEMDPKTRLPVDTSTIVIMDIDDVLTVGTPMVDDEELVLHAVLEPDELLPFELDRDRDDDEDTKITEWFEDPIDDDDE